MVLSYMTIPGVPRPKKNADRIVEIICQRFDVSELKLKSKGRQRKVCDARQLCIYLVKKYTGLSLKTIGEIFGNRDHTTVIHSRDAIINRMSVDGDFRAIVKEIEEMI